MINNLGEIKIISSKRSIKYHCIIALFSIFTIIFIFLTNYKKDFENNEMNSYSNRINYKGVTIKKNKLIEDYFSKISDKYKADKNSEKERIKIFLNLYNYKNDSTSQSFLRLKLLEKISKLKKSKITNLETFFLQINWNFGNLLITINNAIFYCEIVGCHKIILNKNNLKRKWLITKPIFIKNSNITMFQAKYILSL